MAEPLTLELMLELLPKLYVAFPRTLGKDQVRATAVVYRDGLRGLSGDGVRAAVDRVIREDQFFPKVARIRELTREWEKVNRASAAVIDGPKSRRCPVCHTEPQVIGRWRPVISENGTLVLVDRGQSVKLEPYSRELCECAAKCEYAPAVEFSDAPSMPIRALPVFDQFRLAQQKIPSVKWQRPPRRLAAPEAIATPLGDVAQQLARTGL